MDDNTSDHATDEPSSVGAPPPIHVSATADPPEPPSAGGEAPPPPPPSDQPGPPPGGWQPPPPAAGHRRTLRRSSHQRILGGVAAGLADYLDVDPVVIRIAFVVLTVLGGSGLLFYAAGWLLIPADDSGRAVVQDLMEQRPRRRSLVTIVIGTVIAVIAVTNLFSSGPWWPHWDGGNGGFGFFLGLGALALAVVLLVTSGRRTGSPLRWMLLTTIIAVVALTVVAVATVFSVEALSGVPLRGGVGDTQFRPTSPSQVAPRYRLAIGTMHVDLSDVVFRAATTHVTASVGIGNLVVELPPGTAVSVDAHSGLGEVQVFGQDEGGFSTGGALQQAASSGPGPAGNAGNAGNAATGPRIVLDAQTGVGQVQVIRAGP